MDHGPARKFKLWHSGKSREIVKGQLTIKGASSGCWLGVSGCQAGAATNGRPPVKTHDVISGPPPCTTARDLSTQLCLGHGIPLLA